jgi:hypothetical protein
MPMPLPDRFLADPFEEAILPLGFLRALDRASLARNEWPEAGVQRLFKVLKKPGSLGDVCARFGLFSSAAQEQHVRQDWFGEGGKGWWPKEPMEALFRKGMAEAIRLLRKHDLPLASYWRFSKGTRRAQITFAISRHQITLLISTPPPRVRTGHGRAVSNRKIWVVAYDKRERIVVVPGRIPSLDDEPKPPVVPCLI